MTRSFWCLWSGLTVSRFGDGFLAVAVLWQIFAQTGSILALSVTYVAYFAAIGLSRALIGPLADHMNRRRLMVSLDLIRAVLTGIPLILVAFAGLPAAVLAVVYVATGVLQTAYGPASSAILPRLVSPESLGRANSWLFGASEAAHLLGPVAGGLAVAAFGAPQAVALDGLSFALCSACLALIPSGAGGGGTGPAEGEEPYLRRVGAGWRVIRSSPQLSLIAGLQATLFGTDAIFLVLFVPLVALRFHGGATDVGLLEASISAGALVSSFVAGRASWTARPILPWLCTPLFCLATASMAVAPNMAWAYALQALAGLTTGLFLIPSTLAYQADVADGLLGRAFAARGTVVSGGRVVGSLLAGAVGVLAGVGAAFGGIGIAGAVLGGILIASGARRVALARTHDPGQAAVQ